MTIQKPFKNASVFSSLMLLGCVVIHTSVGAQDATVWGVQNLNDHDYSESQEGHLGRYNPWQLPPSSFTDSVEHENDRQQGDKSVQQRAPWGWQFGQEPPTPERPAYRPEYETLPGYTGGKRSKAVPPVYNTPQYGVPPTGDEPYGYVTPGYGASPMYADPTHISPYLDPYPNNPNSYGPPDSDLHYIYPPIR